jgi:hypothetical protein
MKIYKTTNLRDGSRPVRYFSTKEQRRLYIRSEAKRGVTEIKLSDIELGDNKAFIVKLLNDEIGATTI